MSNPEYSSIFDSKESALLEQFAYSDLNESEFLDRYPINLSENKQYLTKLLKTCINNKDGEAVELLLDALAQLEMYRDFDFQSMYRTLIQQKWHRLHESLVDSLDKSIENEDYFMLVLNQVYDYHAHAIEDFMVPIWSKCLWCLYEIKSPKSAETIEAYTSSEFNYLRETAQLLFSKLNEK